MQDPRAEPEDFSLVLGGPLYQLFLRTRMLQPPLDLLKRRLTGIPLFAWLPLLVVSVVEGRAWGGVAVPFLWDIEAHVRFLVALPLLVLAEVVVHRRLRPAVLQFLERGIVRDRDRPRFEAAIAATQRLRNSVVAEVLLVLLVFSAGHVLWAGRFSLRQATWYMDDAASGSALTLAGRWYLWVSLPLFQFIMLRWLYRLGLWCLLLWRISRLDLHLAPLHPDRAGGLGFLSTTTQAFQPLVIGLTSQISALVASQVLYAGANVKQFQMEIAGGVALVLVLVLGPLVVFAPTLLAAKREGLTAYGLLANRYVRDFSAKWLAGAPHDEALIGSADIQSLADLDGSFDAVRGMRILPFGKEAVFPLAVTAALPLLPLAFTMFPADELLRRLVGILL
jgi:hypothetical protein